VLSALAPVAFIPSTDLDRSRRFYEETLGQAVASQDGFAVVLEVNGLNVRVVKVGEEFHVQPFTVFGWRVADLDAEIRDLTARGIDFIRFEGMDQDDLGAWHSPSGTRIAWFRDPDGNTLSLND
jgi:catechol 2,3-dioxygenase-like lactoylglutathione lyase family enzyme